MTARATAIVGVTRIVAALVVLAALAYAYAESIASGNGNPFNYFGYFTNQTNLLASLIVLATGLTMVTRRPVPPWLTAARGVAVACLIIVGLAYYVLVPGTGEAVPWVSATLHAAFPIAAALDWLLVGDREPLPWRRLWLVLPYPVLWMIVVLIRGITDGWVPYGFLLPERGIPSLLAHIGGLLVALLVAGAIVWAASRAPGILRRSHGKNPAGPLAA